MNRMLPFALCLLVLPAWADMFKWTDENGKVHYSDQPPPANAKKSESIKQPKPAAAPPAAAAAPDAAKPAAGPKTPAEQEMEFRKRRLEAAEAEAKAQKEAQATEDKKRNCEKAKAQVASLERGGRITRPGANGEPTYMSDQEIAKELIEARKVTDTWCK
jgi:Domain of unknown function (DUF4124)